MSGATTLLSIHASMMWLGKNLSFNTIHNLRLIYVMCNSESQVLSNTLLAVKVNVKQSLYRPGVAQRVPGI